VSQSPAGSISSSMTTAPEFLLQTVVECFGPLCASILPAIRLPEASVSA